MRKGRLNIYLSPELEKWFRKEAEKAGVSMSSMVAVALHTYREQRDALSVLKDLVERLGQREEEKA